MAKLKFLKINPMSLQILGLTALVAVVLQTLTLLDIILVSTWLFPTIYFFTTGSVLLVEAVWKHYLNASAYKHFNLKDGVNVLSIVTGGYLIASGFLGVNLISAQLAPNILEFFKNTSLMANILAGLLIIYHFFTK